MGNMLAVDYRRRAMVGVITAGVLACIVVVGGGSMVLASILTSEAELREAREAIAAGETGEREQRVRAALAREVVQAATPAEAQAALQTEVKDLARRHGADVASLQPLPARRTGGLALARLQMQASLPEASLAPFLEALAAHSPALLPAGLEILPEAVLATADDPHPERKVAIRLDILSFSQLRAAAGAAP